MKLEISNFRSFQQTSPVYVAPLTVLVGENSAGKTSFLAALRFIHDIVASPESASFNKSPFFLGAYDQVAHLRGGRGGRAPMFSFRFSQSVSMPADPLQRQVHFQVISCTIELSFNNEFSQPVLSRIKFTAGLDWLDVNRKKTGKISVATPGFSFDVDEADAGVFSEADAGRHLMFIFQDIPYLGEPEQKQSRKDQSQRNYLRGMSRRFSFFRRAIRRPVYASAPVRSQPDRAYTPLDASPTPEGTHIPYFLAKLKRHSPNEWEKIKAKIENFGSESGMFRHIDIKNLGRSESDPFQLFVDFGGPQRNIIDVGYGVSQVLPVVTEILSRDEATTFLFQQPEVHLHPQAQAALGTFFVNEIVNGKHQLVLESHSDFIIDRIRMGVRQKIIKSSDVNILFFRRGRLQTDINEITIDNAGNVVNPPVDYRRFFLEEEIRSIG